MQNELQQLGYSSHEIDIYLSLLELGQTTVGPIVKKTGFHRQVVYNTLLELQNKKLVTLVIKANRQNFTANNPQLILEKVNEDKKLAQKIIPQLMDLQTAAKHQQEIKIYEGIDGFQAMHKRCIEEMPFGCPNNVIGSGGANWFRLMKEKGFINFYCQMRLKKKVATRLVAFENQRKGILQTIQADARQGPKGLKYWRFLPDSFDTPAGIQTYNQYVNIIIYDSESLIAFQIKNKLVARKFDKYFEVLWKMAKPLSWRDLPLREKMLK
jgi:predicted transcriptional regulator